jgi:D-alanyl-D-alanine carboxypeptidase/D-alanyl-D-alanine-endopeptidase (penicillin-binding protein 4)
VSAVALDRNSFVVKVEPGKEGAGARVTVFPDGYVELDNQVTTRKKGQGRKLAIELSPKGHGLGAKLTGHVSVGDRALSFQRRIEDPTLYAGYALRKMLERLGVTVEGGVSEGGKDETHLLVERRSEPLSKLLTELGKDSDNYYAETVLKAIGAKISSKRGSSASGADAVKAHLASLGALDSATRIVNGSGLFDANRVSADTLVKVLAAWASRPAFVDQLAVGGVDGTLKHRFRGTRGRIRAKTGTLARAHSLSGYVLDDHGKPKIAFAILLNGVAGKADQQRRWIDKIVEAARRATH